jgi:hypothetical protein
MRETSVVRPMGIDVVTAADKQTDRPVIATEYTGKRLFRGVNT